MIVLTDQFVKNRLSYYYLMPKYIDDDEIDNEFKPINAEIVILITTDSALTASNLRFALKNMILFVICTVLLRDNLVYSTVMYLAYESFNIL